MTCRRTHTRTRNLAARLALTLQGARTSRVGGRWICGNVSDADAGDTTRGRARWVWAYCCNPENPLFCGARSWRQSVRTRGTHAGTGGSFGGRASAQSDGVVSWSVGRPRVYGMCVGDLGPVELMMKLMRRAPQANERQEVSNRDGCKRLSPFFSLSHGASLLSTTVLRRPLEATLPQMPPLQFFTSAASGGSSGAIEALFAA